MKNPTKRSNGGIQVDQYRCEKCGQVFNSRQELQEHEERHQTEASEIKYQ